MAAAGIPEYSSHRNNLLNGYFHEIEGRRAASFIVRIDTKFIYDFFILNFCALAVDFSKEQAFWSNLITTDHVGKTGFQGANCSSVVLELRPEQHHFISLERSSSRALEPRWSNLLRGKSCS
jgi:hypothetical protein